MSNVKYVYKFDDPLGTMDVRKMSDKDLDILIFIYREFTDQTNNFYAPYVPTNLPKSAEQAYSKNRFLTYHNYETTKYLFKQHFPEYLV